MKMYKIAIGKSIISLNMVSISFWIFCFIYIIPSLLVLINQPLFADFSDDMDIYGNASNNLKAWLFQDWLMISVPAGCIFSRTLLHKKNIVNNLKTIIPAKDLIMPSWLNERMLFNTIFYFTILFLFYQILITNSSNPLIVALSGGNPMDVYVSRGELTNGSGIKILDTIIKNDTLLIMSMISFVMKTRSISMKKKWSLLFLCTFLFSIIIGIVNGATGTVIFYVFVFCFLRYSLTGKFVYKLEVIFFSVLIFFLFINFKTGKDEAISIVISHIFERSFFDQSKGFYLALKIFPDMNPYLGFSSAAAWLNKLITGTASPDYGIVIMSFFNPLGVAQGYAGQFTSIFLAEMWANFGWIGILVGPFWVGTVLYTVHYFLKTRKQTIISIAMYAHASIFGFGYFSDFVRFYYPVNAILTYLGPLIILFCGFTISVFLRYLLKNPPKINFTLGNN
jgi:hypothetical protein